MLTSMNRTVIQDRIGCGTNGQARECPLSCGADWDCSKSSKSLSTVMWCWNCFTSIKVSLCIFVYCKIAKHLGFLLQREQRVAADCCASITWHKQMTGRRAAGSSLSSLHVIRQQRLCTKCKVTQIATRGWGEVVKAQTTRPLLQDVLILRRWHKPEIPHTHPTDKHFLLHCTQSWVNNDYITETDRVTPNYRCK